MKIGEFLPDIVNKDTQLTQGNQWLNKLYDMGFTGFMKAQYGSNVESAAQYYGIEQLYFDWLRQAYAYRRMFIQDLYLLAFDCSEIRGPLLHLKKEIFRKGFDDWHPKFVARCDKCDINFQNEEEGEKHKKDRGHKLIRPNKKQVQEFDNKWRFKCNIFGQDLESVLKTIEDDLNICLVPGTLVYRIDGKQGQGYFPIETFEVGQKVYTHKGRARKILKTYQRQVSEDLIVLCLDNGQIIKITGNHPVYTTRGWVRSDELTLSDVLLKISDVRTFSNNMTPEERKERCWDKSAISRKGKKRGKYATVSPKKNLSYKEYYGEERAKEIISKIVNTKTENGVFTGVGFNFRAKVGNFCGENNPNWNDGSSFEPYGIEFNNALRVKIYSRDNHTCQSCGAYSIRCNCHHIDYDKQNNNEENLITLCDSCHSKTNYNRDVWMVDLQKKVSEKYDLVHNGTRIIKIDKEFYDGTVYNLEVEEDNSYVGKGIIYHNCDDAYIHLNKQYKYINGELHTQLLEVRRIHPALMEFDLDKNGLPNNSHWFCPIHRNDVKAGPGNCEESGCSSHLLPAMYVYNHRGGRVYMHEDEIIHVSKFSPHETYGYSPILTLMQKVLTITGMDRFLYRYFFERKTPTQMILTNTDDPQSLELERARMEAKMMEDPTYTPWIAVSNRTGRGKTDVVKLFHTLHEMDYMNVRNEIRDRIAGIYGVPQMYYNVMEGVGGLSGQTQQLKMMSNVVASDQRMFNEKIIPIILKNIGITDWEIKLRTPEEKIEGEILQLAQQKVSIATAMRQMGYDIALKPGAWDIDTMDFSFSGKSMSLQEQQQMMMMQGPGGMGGDPGAMGGGGVPVDLPGGVVPGGAPSGEEKTAPQKPGRERKPEHPLHIDEIPEMETPRSKKHRLEEAAYNVPTPEEEEEEEKDNVDEAAWG